MIKQLLVKTALKLLGIVLAVTFITASLFAQAPRRGTAKPIVIIKKKTLKKSQVNASNKVVINTSMVNFLEIPGEIADSFIYIHPKLSLNIAGKTPKSDIKVKLTIENKSSIKQVQFSSSAIDQMSTTLNIDKSSFSADGAAKKISSHPIDIRLKIPVPVSPLSGNIYISIANQPEYYYDIVFSSYASPDNAVNSNPPMPLKRPSISIDTLTSNFHLDTSGTSPQLVSTDLKINLSKGVWKNDSIYVSPAPMISSQSITVMNSDKTIPLAIDSHEWNNSHPVTVKRTIKFYIQQPTLAKDTQYVNITAKGMNGWHTIKLLPYKGKAKPKTSLANLVQFGDAEIIPGKVGISHFYGTKINSIDSIHLKVKIYGKYTDTSHVLSFGFIDTGVAKHFKIWPNPDTITKREWEKVQRKSSDTTSANREGELDIPLKIITVNLNDSLNNVQYIDLILNKQGHISGNSQKIKLSIKDQPFWAEVGANFDQLDNIKANNVYVGVYMFDKDKGKINPFGWFNPKDNNLSFTGGVYESQSQSINSYSNASFIYKDGTSPVIDTFGNVKSYKHYVDTGIINSTTNVKRVGIFISPHLRLTNGKTDENGIHFFVSAYLEMLWQRVTTTFDYSKTRNVYTVTDTGASAINNYNNNIPYKIQSLNFDYRSHYMGLGIPFYIKEQDFSLYINGVWGFTNQQFVIINDNVNENLYRPIILIPGTEYNALVNFSRPKSGWNQFYIAQYRLTESKLGIVFSGEIRGLYIPGSKPIITLALSKKFDLSALLKPLVSPFNK